jgi:hypothetical protein
VSFSWRRRRNTPGQDRSSPTSRSMYRIRIVDASDDDVADTLADLHRLAFFDVGAMPQFDFGAWWLAYNGDDAVASAGVVPSAHARNSGYFSRVGVLLRHWGRAATQVDAGGRSARATYRMALSSGRAIGSTNPRCPGPGRILFTGEGPLAGQLEKVSRDTEHDIRNERTACARLGTASVVPEFPTAVQLDRCRTVFAFQVT